MSFPGTPINPESSPTLHSHVDKHEISDKRYELFNEKTIVCLCTGNAARSPMAQVILKAALPIANVTSAGTHVVEGQPISWRTRLGLQVVRPDLASRLNSHRSRQISQVDINNADLILCMATEHVNYVRREFPNASHKTGSLRRLAGSLPAGHFTSLSERIAEMHLEQVALQAWEDIEDPGGGDVEVMATCAQVLDEELSKLVYRISMMSRS